MFQPSHLSLFAIDRGSGKPIVRLPFYAEVGAPAPVIPAPIETDRRFDEPTIGALQKADSDCAHNPSCQSRVLAATSQALVQVIPEQTRDELAKNNPSAAKLLSEMLKRAVALAGTKLRDLDAQKLDSTIEQALTDAARG